MAEKFDQILRRGKFDERFGTLIDMETVAIGKIDIVKNTLHSAKLR